MAAGPQLVEVLYGAKWSPGLPAFYLFSVSLWAASLLGTNYYNLFYAAGRPRLALYFTALYGVSDWAVAIPLVMWLGFTGIAVRAVLVSFAILPFLLAAGNRIVPVQAVRQVVRPAGAAMFAGLLEFALIHVLHRGRIGLVTAVISSGMVYLVLISAWEHESLALALRRLAPPPVLRVFSWYVAEPRRTEV